jgi:alginate O-acetyltransferase complex protein AlgI
MPLASIHFIFIFLPLVLILYIIPNSKYRNLVLLLVSLFFFLWGDPGYLPVLLASILINYFFGRAIGIPKEGNHGKKRAALLWAAICINLAILFFYKYLGFFTDNLQLLINRPLALKVLGLPLGISYFTFSAISYVVDIYNQVEPPEKNLLRFSVYLAMFPKLLQGPITRFTQIRKQIVAPAYNLDGVIGGSRRFIAGLAKKVILADNLAVVANKVFSADFSQVGIGVAWYGLIAYALQIYFDFSGYTDMAIGIGMMLGFTFPENFNFPYISKSITDFWRRWHMSLIAWFRTYVFIPLEFARKNAKYLRQQTDIIIVFLLTGLWHGASWNFIFWGMYFGLILAIEASGFEKKLRKVPAFFQHFYALFLVAIGWVFFRLSDLQLWSGYFGALFGKNGWDSTTTVRTLNIWSYFPLFLLSIFFSLPVLSNAQKMLVQKYPVAQILVDLLYLALFITSIAYLLSNGFTSFIYGNF